MLLTSIRLINSNVIGSQYLVEILTKLLFALSEHWLKIIDFFFKEAVMILVGKGFSHIFGKMEQYSIASCPQMKGK